MKSISLKQVSPVCALLVLAFLIYSLVIFPYAPLQDLPEWVYQSYVFNELVSGHTSNDFELKSYPVPYAFFQLITSAVLMIFSPFVTSKIVVLLYGILILSSIHLFLSRARIDPLIGWVFMISVVALNSPFWNGYMGYQFGLIVLLFYLSLPGESRTAIFPVLTISVLAFFAHGIILASMLVFMGIYSLYSRRILQYTLGVLPSLCLAAWYVIKNDSSGELNEIYQLHDLNVIAYKAYTFLKTAPFHNPKIASFNPIEYFGSSYLIGGILLDTVFAASLAALAFAAVTRSSLRAIVVKPEFAIFGILLAVALALPPSALGIANSGERVLYPALIAFAMAVYAVPDLPMVPKVTLTAALIGCYGLMAIALVPESAIYRDTKESPGTGQQTTELALSSRLLFGHRFMQYDGKMKQLEQAWRSATLPAPPLAFDTALISAKSR